MIDIVNIKSAVKNGQIEFFVKENNIYCKDKQSEEIVKLTNVKQKSNLKLPKDPPVERIYEKGIFGF